MEELVDTDLPRTPRTGGDSDLSSRLFRTSPEEEDLDWGCIRGGDVDCLPRRAGEPGRGERSRLGGGLAERRMGLGERRRARCIGERERGEGERDP